jgi:hypothetical protein
VALCHGYAKGLARRLIESSGNGQAVSLLIRLYSGFCLGSPHPIDGAGVVSGRLQLFLDATNLIWSQLVFLGCQKVTPMALPAHIHEDQSHQDEDADNSRDEEPLHMLSPELPLASHGTQWAGVECVGRLELGERFGHPLLLFLSPGGHGDVFA